MKKIVQVASFATVATLVLVGCGADGSTQTDDGTVKVVTTTDVYADIVKAIAGDKVEVTPLIASTAVDPHSYEATSSDRLTVKDADLVVLNGGGYDTFLEELAGSDNKDQKVINAVEISGLFSEEELAHIADEHTDHEGEEHNHVHTYNEHVWYDLDTMKKVGQKVAEDLATLDAGNAQTYRDAASSLDKQLDELLTRAKGVDTKERSYLATEPVPGYLLEDAGYKDVTPSDLVAAVETDSDIAPLTMQEAKDVLTKGGADLLAFNEQTQTAQTKEIFNFAQEAKVPSISFTETLPEKQTYVQWMAGNIENIEKAVA
ncbi:MAG: zinc ABC transporter substrate-binding protein [Rothia sp. (in: high G+C Gram-positive bacteria)]|nr:zinc ABC transporter substrate-binding protein [Rothia sp. (in: high G+C Gram-positive bacteria)]